MGEGAPFRAITLHQPWASLTMLRDNGCICNGDSPPDLSCPGVRMVKRFETRSFRAPSTIIGQRIWIHAGVKFPKELHDDGGQQWTKPNGPWPSWTDGLGPEDWASCWDWWEWPNGDGCTHSWRGPNGVLVGSAVIGEPLPIDGAVNCPYASHVIVWADGQISICDGGSSGGGVQFDDISDQMPYGDWQPGRWAWPLLDPWPLTEPIPAKGAQGVWFTDHAPEETR